MSHTPGPWWNTGLELQASPYSGIEIWGWPDSEKEYQAFVALVLSTQASVPEDQTQDNARLIAAAPDLLVALQGWLVLTQASLDLRCLLAQGDPGVKLVKMTIAALAKAQGETDNDG